MAYELELTEDNVKTIAFVGHRYGWSDALKSFAEGTNELAEHEAWEVREAIESDTEGGHSLFPMLGHACGSNGQIEGCLRCKLLDFIDGII